MTKDGNENAEPRHISAPLMIGLVALPIVFVWFLFGRGYARSTRTAALVCTFTLPVLSLIISAIVHIFGLPTD